MSDKKNKTLGEAIDELTRALDGLDNDTKIIAINAVIGYLDIPFNASSRINSEQQITSKTDQKVENTLISKNALDIKSLKEEKVPSNSIEMACVVAFYLENYAPEYDKKDIITTKDLEKYFKQAKYQLPKQMNQVLVDGKAAGYFDRVSSGKYKLNPVGYNLVAYKLPKKSSK